MGKTEEELLAASQRQSEIEAQQIIDQEEIDKQRKALEADKAALAHEQKRHLENLEAFEVGQPDQASLSEIGLHSKGVVQVTDRMPTADELELEAFMNEELIVTVNKSGNKEENPVCVPSVNGVNQPCPLGVRLRIRRKYVEALGHSRVEIIEQADENPMMRVEGIDIVAQAALTHNFTVHGDSEKGNEWLAHMLAQPV